MKLNTIFIKVILTFSIITFVLLLAMAYVAYIDIEKILRVFYTQEIVDSSLYSDQLSKEQNVDKAMSTVFRWLSLDILLGLLCTLLGATWFSRRWTRPFYRALKFTDAVSKGDLSRRVQTRRTDEFGDLFTNLNKMSSALAQLVGEVRGVAQTIDQVADDIINGNNSLSKRSEQQGVSLQEIASNIHAMTNHVKLNSQNSAKANELALGNKDQATNGKQIVNQAINSMQEIRAESKHMVGIIAAIESISFQTNLLSINAAVEAAQAGERGRGFAVVAQEVRNLANNSAESATEIKEMVDASVDKIQAGAQMVNRTGEAFEEIVANIAQLSNLISDINVSCGEQNIGIDQVNKGIHQIEQLTDDNAEIVEQAYKASKKMKQQTEHLNGLLERFKLG